MNWLGTIGSPLGQGGGSKWLRAGTLLMLTALGGCVGPGLEPPLETTDADGPGGSAAGVGATGDPAGEMARDGIPDDGLTPPPQTGAGSQDAGTIDIDAGAGSLDAGLGDMDSEADGGTLEAGSDGGTTAP